MECMPTKIHKRVENIRARLATGGGELEGVMGAHVKGETIGMVVARRHSNHG